MHIERIFGARHRQHESGDLLQRAGYVRQHASGIYSYLTLGLRSLRRIEAIVRDEMDRTGAQEILMPLVHDGDVWKATGRYGQIDETLLRFQDRRGHDMVLGMTRDHRRGRGEAPMGGRPDPGTEGHRDLRIAALRRALPRVEAPPAAVPTRPLRTTLLLHERFFV